MADVNAGAGDEVLRDPSEGQVTDEYVRREELFDVPHRTRHLDARRWGKELAAQSAITRALDEGNAVAIARADGSVVQVTRANFTHTVSRR